MYHTKESYMKEISRDKFVQMINHDEFPSIESVAVSLFVLQENWEKIRESDPRMLEIVQRGKQVLVSIPHEGLFALYGWAAYFACINCTKTTVVRELDNVINELSQIDENCRFWMYGVAELATSPSNVYFDLEWKSYESARESLRLKLVSETHCVYMA